MKNNFKNYIQANKKALGFLQEPIAIVGGVGWGGKPCAG